MTFFVSVGWKEFDNGRKRKIEVERFVVVAYSYAHVLKCLRISKRRKILSIVCAKSEFLNLDDE